MANKNPDIWSDKIIKAVTKKHGKYFLYPLLNVLPVSLPESEFDQLLIDLKANIIAFDKFISEIDEKYSSEIKSKSSVINAGAIEMNKMVKELLVLFDETDKTKFLFILLLKFSKFAAEKRNRITPMQKCIDKYGVDNIFSAMTVLSAYEGDINNTIFFSLRFSDWKIALLEAEAKLIDKRKLTDSTLMGEKMLSNLEEARRISASIRSKRSYENKKEWREMSIKTWQNNPGWTLDDMADWIKEETKTAATTGTIKEAIKGIKTSVLKRKAK
jgi:hypothetical protein